MYDNIHQEDLPPTIWDELDNAIALREDLAIHIADAVADGHQPQIARVIIYLQTRAKIDALNAEIHKTPAPQR